MALTDGERLGWPTVTLNDALANPPCPSFTLSETVAVPGLLADRRIVPVDATNADTTSVLLEEAYAVNESPSGSVTT